ncbi:MAG: FAD-dependent oxidoreductase [Clostridia bacterium]|nr:FAD-dependent oxidoreductase [Clostridia bacterium]
MVDVLIVGGGPAGLTAALYAGRAGKSITVLEKNAFGGQITWSPKVENFPATAALSGLEFSDRLTEQVLRYGVNLESDEVNAVQVENNLVRVSTVFGDTYEAKTLILATGAAPRRLGLPEEERFIGAGVSFCAVCDGEFFREKTVAVVGGGNTALQEAIYLSALCKTVYLIHRRAEFRADQSLVSAMATHPNIFFLPDRVVTQLKGESRLSAVVLERKDGTTEELAVDGLFLAVGHTPENALFPSIVPITDQGYADADESCKTNFPQIFVAGDCRQKQVQQLTTAVSDGATAALAACRYLDESV